ncbi:MAG: hypothetical protein Q7K16_02210, partial [Candidatus Azambacteria bacterium]|nr:hypothetical protein [Candidatus Azambacteria bacterium]
MKFHRYKAIIAFLLVFILFFSHAATSMASSTYMYDRNGNLGLANGWRYNWDYNNRLTDALLGTTTKVR